MFRIFVPEDQLAPATTELNKRGARIHGLDRDAGHFVVIQADAAPEVIDSYSAWLQSVIGQPVRIESALATHRYIQAYTHHGRIGVMLELATQLTATTDEQAFADLSRDLAMHIAACNPQTVAQLLLQPFVRDQGLTVQQHLAWASKRLEDEIRVLRFVRWDHASTDPETDTPPWRPAVVMRIA